MRLVDRNIAWSDYLKELRQKGIHGDVLRKRVGFCIYVARERNLDITQKVSALTRAFNWPGYGDNNWEKELEDAEVFFVYIEDLIRDLKKQEFLTKDSLHREVSTIIAMENLSSIGLSEKESEIVTMLFGSYIINGFFNETEYKKESNIYQFLYALSIWLRQNDIDPIRVKRKEVEDLKRYIINEHKT